MRRRFILLLMAAALISVAGLAACGNDHSQSETTAAFEDLDLSAYDDLNTGEVILLRSDGNIEIWDNSDYSSGIDLFLHGGRIR